MPIKREVCPRGILNPLTLIKRRGMQSRLTDLWKGQQLSGRLATDCQHDEAFAQTTGVPSDHNGVARGPTNHF
ncbi:hypothetical protein CEXT_400101 [Caerostris extrusa]|uniref:Uncharacterized protein n=1 Tax=Caerostris extrusa TaxID=172846 RepID=A0AAV4VNM5_CAEEX|nr:hypothetical protein CEXT_400101 [Caerostris extrusa]